jgi:hypothetical protein
MRMIIVAAGAALALAACNGNKADNNADANMSDLNATDPNAANMMMTDDNSALANGAGGADMNTATNAATENAMAKDMNTNDKDTNLKNGL